MRIGMRCMQARSNILHRQTANRVRLGSTPDGPGHAALPDHRASTPLCAGAPTDASLHACHGQRPHGARAQGARSRGAGQRARAWMTTAAARRRTKARRTRSMRSVAWMHSTALRAGVTPLTLQHAGRGGALLIEEHGSAHASTAAVAAAPPAQAAHAAGRAGGRARACRLMRAAASSRRPSTPARKNSFVRPNWNWSAVTSKCASRSRHAATAAAPPPARRAPCGVRPPDRAQQRDMQPSRAAGPRGRRR